MTTREQTLKECIDLIPFLSTESTLMLLLASTKRYLQAELGRTVAADELLGRTAEAALDSLRVAGERRVGLVLMLRRWGRAKTVYLYTEKLLLWPETYETFRGFYRKKFSTYQQSILYPNHAGRKQ